MMNEIKNMAAVFPLGQVRLLDGIFKDRQEINARFLMQIDPDRLLVGFREQAGLPARCTRYGGWESRDIAGHSLGHYLSALSYLYAATGEPAVKARVDYIVAELDACQCSGGDGYVLPVLKKTFTDLRNGIINATPFSLNGVWVPNYTLHKVLAGLRDAWHQTGNRTALEIEHQLGNWLCGILSGLTPAQIQEMLCTEHGGMNEVLADLAADTGDAFFLDMARDAFHHKVVVDPLLRGEDRLDGLHGNTQIPKVVGLAREYELTGTPEYRQAAESFWHSVVHCRSYAIGGHGESEHFFPPEQFPERLTPFTAETCNTYNMLKLTRHLFSWAPDAEKMDFVERAMINHLAANIGHNPGEFGYFLGLAAVGVKVFSQPFESWWCCVGTGMENPSRYGEQIYFHHDDTLWVNLFIGSTLSWPEKCMTLCQQTDFPDSGTVRFTITCDGPVKLALLLRHPYWCRKPAVKINGAVIAVASAPSSYMVLERVWRDGDTVELDLPMTLRFEPLPYSGDKVVALMYGPSVMAGIIPPENASADPAKLRFGDHLKARGKTDEFPPLFVGPDAVSVLASLHSSGTDDAGFRSSGCVVPGDLDFMPFHRVYEEHYCVYFSLMTAEEWAREKMSIMAAQEQRRALEAALLDVITPGYQQPEVEHKLQMKNSGIDEFQGRKCRFAENDGWFSYEITVDPAVPVSLMVTYWGGEWGDRIFDLLVDGQVVATQKLYADKPGDFFEVTYPVAAALTRGKTTVTLCFQPYPGNIAGRVFAIRVLRAEEQMPD